MTYLSSSKAVEAVLDIARWAPSGDNAQPWSFAITGEREVTLTISRINPNIYEYRHGEPTLLSAGALLENIQLAAPSVGLEARWRYAGSRDGKDRVVVSFDDDGAAVVSELFGEIRRRSVDRRPFQMKALTREQETRLSEALDSNMHVEWYSSLADRYTIAGLSACATKIRLTIPETFEVHREIVDWENLESEYGIPAGALGLDPVTLRLTRWSMQKWSRTALMNALGAPTFASLQMDILPGIFSAAYFTIRLKRHSERGDEGLIKTLQAGQAIQRFWLTVSRLGLVMQPCVAILAFWTYAAEGRNFTALPAARRKAAQLAVRSDAMFGNSADIMFLGRVGRPRRASSSRSIRLPLARLLGQ